jgi:hypothetical protein
MYRQTIDTCIPDAIRWKNSTAGQGLCFEARTDDGGKQKGFEEQILSGHWLP